MRIEKHPILDFERGKEVKFYFGEIEMAGYEGETIAAALHANGVMELSHSEENHRPRGFYCAIGNCSSCLMEVNGVPNVRVCVEDLEEGMKVNLQKGMGDVL